MLFGSKNSPRLGGMNDSPPDSAQSHGYLRRHAFIGLYGNGLRFLYFGDLVIGGQGLLELLLRNDRADVGGRQVELLALTVGLGIGFGRRRSCLGTRGRLGGVHAVAS